MSRKADTVSETLEAIRARYDLPAMAVAVVKQGKIVATEAVGVRKFGDETPVTPNDRFHLGSCTKAMTATLIGMQVERKNLDWKTPLSDALPDMAREMHPELRGVTVDMLLAHRSGLSGESWPKGKTFGDMHDLPGSPRRQREAYARRILAQEPENPPGAKYVYANAGFALLGVILERLTNTEWETLMERQLFAPLGMKSAGFGAMGTPEKIEQPYQHVRRKDGRPAPIDPGPRSDNPPVIGPGGTVHASVGDWAKFVAIHLRDGKSLDNRPILRPETTRRLHEPQFGGDYAGGWAVTERGWGGGRVLNHSGSNNMNFAVVWAAPLREFAVLVATNIAGDDAPKACDAVAAAMLQRFLP